MITKFNFCNYLFSDVVEGGIRLKLTIVETAGFGDQLDKDKRLVICGRGNYPGFYSN